MSVNRSVLDGQAAGVARERFPLVGEKFAQAIGGMRHDPPEDVVEVFPRIYVAGLAGLDEAEVECGGPTAAFTAGEEPVLASDCERTNRVLGSVVVGFELPVFEEAPEGVLLVEGVVQRGPQGFRGQ